MNEITMIRALRTDYAYPEEQRRAARAVLLAEMAGAAAGAPPAAPPRRARRRVPWQAGLGGVLAAGAAAVVAVAYLPGGAPGRVTARTAAPATAAQVLELAAKKTASSTAAPVPAGARWLVWEARTDSTAWSGPECRMAAAVAGNPDNPIKIRGTLACQAQPPASIPQLRRAKPIPDLNGPHWGRLPSQPGPLLAAIYRQLRAQPKDSVPGKPPGTVTAADLNQEAFDVLRTMLTSGLTSPSQAVQLAAMARIPGIKIVHGAHSLLGRPAIEITVAGSEDRESEFLDPSSYTPLGGTIFTDLPATGPVTITSSRVWQAYYDSNGNKL